MGGICPPTLGGSPGQFQYFDEPVTFAPRPAYPRPQQPARVKPAPQSRPVVPTAAPTVTPERFDFPQPDDLGISLREPVPFPPPDALGIAVE